MAQAKRSLSPKRAAERMRQHRHAVMVLAMQSAKRTVKAHIRAQGLKISQFTCCEISRLADAELERNRAQLIAEAEHTIETWLGFARYRVSANITTNAQKHSEPISTTSALQIFGAK
jgi:hypothetical protein